MMSSESGKEESYPSSSMDNFASWLRYLSQEHQGRVIKLTQELREILPGFDSFKITRTGEDHRTLKLAFDDDTGTTTQSIYKFDELSDGQRALVCLYGLIHCALPEGADEEATLCIDEPENYLALPEIQPWLTNLYDRIEETGGQVVLISHHPELINYLASSAGYWFDRDREAPVRVKRITSELDGGLPVSELVARGRVYEPD
jgi:predicted ATPase